MEIDGLTYEMTLLEKVKHFKNEALKAIVNSDEDYKIKLKVLCDNQLLGYDIFYSKFRDFIVPFEEKLILFLEDIEEYNRKPYYKIKTLANKIENNNIEKYSRVSIFQYIKQIEESIWDFKCNFDYEKELVGEFKWIEDFMENLYKEVFEFAINNNIDSFTIYW